MANPHRGQVPFTVGEREFTLSFSINATCELENHFDLPISKVAEKLNSPDGVRMNDIRAIIWAALQDNHPDTTIKEAGDIATEAGLNAVMEAISKCFVAAFPQDEVDKTARPKKAAKA